MMGALLFFVRVLYKQAGGRFTIGGPFSVAHTLLLCTQSSLYCLTWTKHTSSLGAEKEICVIFSWMSPLQCQNNPTLITLLFFFFFFHSLFMSVPLLGVFINKVTQFRKPRLYSWQLFDLEDSVFQYLDWISKIEGVITCRVSPRFFFPSLCCFVVVLYTSGQARSKLCCHLSEYEGVRDLLCNSGKEGRVMKELLTQQVNFDRQLHRAILAYSSLSLSLSIPSTNLPLSLYFLATKFCKFYNGCLTCPLVITCVMVHYQSQKDIFKFPLVLLDNRSQNRINIKMRCRHSWFSIVVFFF